MKATLKRLVGLYEFKEWIVDDFDPSVAPECLVGKVTTLAKRWSRKPIVKRSRHA